MDAEGKPFGNIPECQNTNKKLRKQDDTTEQDIDHDGQNAKAVGTVRPHLPDSVVHQILQFLPTKSAVRMSILAKQREGVWSSFPGLDFEEDNEQLDDRNLEKLGHSRFISFLEKCLEDFRMKNEKVLQKLSLRMRRCSPRDDSDIVDRFLNFALDRSVKELDISLRSECGVERYRLAPQTFLNAKSIAALNLEHVTLYYQFERPSPSNPFLKTLSLKSVHISKVRLEFQAPVSNQLCFTFIGHLRSMNNISVEAPNLSEVRIQLRDSEPAIDWSWNHFSTLSDFLHNFACSEKVALFVRDVEALNFPEDFTKTCSSPLRNVKELEVRILSPSGARDSDLRDSLVWMAPSASIPPVKYSRDISPT